MPTKTSMPETDNEDQDLNMQTHDEALKPADAGFNTQMSNEDVNRQLSDEELDTFPREYVERLRQEAAENRVKAKRADDLAQRLHLALVTASGRLADPTDLAYDESHLETPEALSEAIEALLARKPHLASRRPRGDVGQGATGVVSDTVDLAGLLRARA